MHRDDPISLLVPRLPTAGDLAPYLSRIDTARRYTNFGPLVEEFETRLLEHCRGGHGPLHGTTVSSATLGLELALAALGLPAGSLVLVPSLTFVATATAVVRAGLRPLLADIDPDTWLLTPGIASAAAARAAVAAVMPVATFGCPQEVAEWTAFERRTGIPVVVDAAGAFGNQLAGGRVCVVYSLHATKALSAGEGGFVVAEDETWIRRVRRLSNFGIEPSGHVTIPGSNAKLSEYHAAAGLASLDCWDETRNRRRQLRATYLRHLEAELPQLRFQAQPAELVHTLLPVLLPPGIEVEAVRSRLSETGIETRRWYWPSLPEHAAFRDAPHAGDLDVTADVSSRLLGLPFHEYLFEDDVRRVASALAAALLNVPRR